MSITQKSRIQIRTGLQQNLPVLKAGEMGFAVDTQRLFIGNGNISDGAPFPGNTEILTTMSAKPSTSNTNYTSVAGTFQQSPDGTRTTFWTTGNVSPITNSLIIWKNFPLIPNNGYTVSGYAVTFTSAPLSTDSLYWQGWILT